MNTLSIITFLLGVSEVVNGAKILSITPALDINYKTLYLPLWRKLADRGHDITLLTTVQMEPHENITQIDVSKYYVFKNERRDGPNPLKTPSMLELMVAHKVDIANQTLIKNLKDEHFDLVFVELGLPFWTSTPRFYGSRFIGINNRDASPLVHFYQGNAMHPSIYPLTEKPHVEEGFFKRSMNALETFASFITSTLYLDKGRELMWNIFEVNLLDSMTMLGYMDLMFVNVNPIFDSLRPVVSTTVNLGGFLSAGDQRKLPKDLQKYLDESKNGCIYVSFGTTVNSEYLSKEQKDTFVKVFKAMAPMRILWKFDDLNVAKGVSNVEVRKWVPQQDVLRHPNVKLFITQGGLQSMEEAIDSAVPMLGMPFYGDQVNNVNKMHEKEFGLRLIPKEMSEESLKSSLQELLKNPKYKKNIDKFSAISKDQPMKGLEKAVWWTEYVLRHGTQHLRSPSADIPLYQYFFLDVIAFLAAFVYCFYYLIKSCVRVSWSLVRSLYRAVKGIKDKED